MSEDLISIKLTETEIIHIMDSLRERIADLQDDHAITGMMESADLADELQDLEHDLLEAHARRDDDWGRENDPMPSAALDMVQAGIDAREQTKASSMAAERRAERMMKGTASPVAEDWNPNDPVNW